MIIQKLFKINIKYTTALYFCSAVKAWVIRKKIAYQISLHATRAFPGPEIAVIARTCARRRKCIIPPPAPKRESFIFPLSGRMIEHAMAGNARLSAGSIGDNEVHRKSCTHGTESFPRRAIIETLLGDVRLFKMITERSNLITEIALRAFIILYLNYMHPD